MRQRRRAGLFAALGIHVGEFAHVAVAVCGLAVLFEAVPILDVTPKTAIFLRGSHSAGWIIQRVGGSTWPERGPQSAMTAKAGQYKQTFVSNTLTVGIHE